jgi:anti-anti-sigma regulatory factor
MPQPNFSFVADGTNPHKGILTITGDLSLNNTIEVHKEILAKIDNFEQVEIVMKNISVLDVSGIQLLYSLSITKPNYTINASIADDIRPIIENAGFNSINIIKN